jgi:hypothetical protein
MFSTPCLHKILSLAAAFLLLQNPVRIPGPGGRSQVLAPSYVQSASCQPSGAVSVTCAFTNPIAVGDAGVVLGSWVTGGTITISSVVDGDSNSYSNTAWASGAGNCVSNGSDTRLYTKFNITQNDAGTETITVTFSSAPSFSVAVSMIELNGASAIDQADCQGQIGTTTPTSPSVTTTTADFLYGYSFDTNEDSRTWTAGTVPAYTLRGPNGDLNSQETFSQTSAGAVTGNFTVNTSDNFSTAIVALH